MLAYHDVFSQVFEQTDKINVLPNSSIEDAIKYFEVDLLLWQETENSLDWLRSHLIDRNVRPPCRDLPERSVDKDSKKEDTNELNEMFLTMFETGIEMILEQKTTNKRLKRAN